MQYLLSTHTVEGSVPGAPQTPEEMQAFMERVLALEAEMDAARAFVFGGALDGPDTANVVRPNGGDQAATPGPFVQGPAHLAGFYIIEADGADAAQAWASRVAEATNHPIEVRPFRATGRMRDAMGGS